MQFIMSFSRQTNPVWDVMFALSFAWAVRVMCFYAWHCLSLRCSIGEVSLQLWLSECQLSLHQYIFLLKKYIVAVLLIPKERLLEVGRVGRNIKHLSMKFWDWVCKNWRTYHMSAKKTIYLAKPRYWTSLGTLWITVLQETISFFIFNNYVECK
jgi:hypothetical protein